MEKSKEIKKLDYLTLRALKANGLSTCNNCPIGFNNCNDLYIKLCTFAFIKGYKSGYRSKNKNKNSFTGKQIK